jgi:hypothetical protein
MGWISVEDRLPDGSVDETWVLVCADGAMNCMAYSKGKWKRWACKESDPLFNIRVDNITHWMPLPDPPERHDKNHAKNDP